MTRRTIIAALVLTASVAATAAADPPERVARVSFIGGIVSFRSAAATEWSPAAANYPLTVGDHLWTDRGGRVELQMGTTAVNLDATSAISLLNLDYQIVQLRLAQGSAIVRVCEHQRDETIEVDTPNGAVTLNEPGVYRIDVPQSADATTVTVRRGTAEIGGASAATEIHAAQSMTISGVDGASQTAVAAVPLDDFEDWAVFRERRVDAAASVRYVPRAVVGYDDLDEFGTWRVVPEYGPVWAPRVVANWAPYRFGHWTWVEPWGWTWIDDAPWGFAPFHYGRWAFVGGGWVWVPGAVVVRPVYAPALVAFVGGPGWRVGVGAPVGWFPLGPREVFVPAYTVSPAYVVAVNRPHAAAVNVNVTNVTYVNRAAPGAVTVVPRDTFVRAQPVAPAMVQVAPEAMNSAVVIGHAVPRDVAPVVVPRAAVVAAPPPVVANRPVVVRTPPSPAVPATTVRRTAPAPPAAARPAPAQAQPAPPQAQPAPAQAQPAPAQARPAPTQAQPAPAQARPAPAQAQPAPPQAQPAPNASPAPAAPRPAAAVARPVPDRSGEIAARHAQERNEIAQRHAAEREALRARQVEEVKHAPNGQGRADVQARHARERADLDARQKGEREQMQARHESERRGRQ